MERFMEDGKDTPWVLLIRSDGFYGTDIYLERALRRKYNVITIALSVSNFVDRVRRNLPTRLVDLVDKIIPFRPKFVHSGLIHADLILVVDPVRKKFDFSGFDAPTVYYAIDSHIAFHHHIKTAHVQDYDYLFVAQKDWVSRYKERGCEKVYWLPLACDPEIHKRHNLPIVYDLCFLGKLRGIREQFVLRLQREFNMFVGTKFLHDMAKTYSQSKIIFNKSLLGDLNMRVFETLSCGRLLITDRITNGLEDLFNNKGHLVLYNDWNDLVEKVRYYLNNPNEREQIASCGQKEVHLHHTYKHRVNYLMNTVLGSNDELDEL